MTDKNGIYRNSIIQYLLNSQWFAKEKNHRRSHDFDGQNMLPLVTLALILTAVRNDLSFIILRLNDLLDLLITGRFRVPLMFGKLVKRFRVNLTTSHTGPDITNILRNLRHGQRSLQNAARWQVAMPVICALNCTRICFAMPGKRFLFYNLQIFPSLILLTLLSAPVYLSLPNKLLILLRQMMKQLYWRSLRQILVEALADGGASILESYAGIFLQVTSFLNREGDHESIYLCFSY